MSVALDTPIHTSAQSIDRVLSTRLPALLIFETPGCEPCRTLEPALKDLARDFAGRVLVVRVDDSNQGNLAVRFKVTRVPALIFWSEGRENGRIEGAARPEELRAHLNYWLGQAAAPAPASGPSQPLPGAARPASGGGQPAGAQQPSQAGETSKSNGAPLVVTDDTFDSLVLQSPLPVLVDFWAPWCGPCRMVSPIVEEFGRQYNGRLRVAKVNTDENPIRASSLGIQGIPTLIFFKGGREVDRIVGAAPKPMLQSRIERVLSST